MRFLQGAAGTRRVWRGEAAGLRGSQPAPPGTAQGPHALPGVITRVESQEGAPSPSGRGPQQGERGEGGSPSTSPRGSVHCSPLPCSDRGVLAGAPWKGAPELGRDTPGRTAERLAVTGRCSPPGGRFTLCVGCPLWPQGPGCGWMYFIFCVLVLGHTRRYSGPPGATPGWVLGGGPAGCGVGGAAGCPPGRPLGSSLTSAALQTLLSEDPVAPGPTVALGGSWGMKWSLQDPKVRTRGPWAGGGFIGRCLLPVS